MKVKKPVAALLATSMALAACGPRAAEVSPSTPVNASATAENTLQIPPMPDTLPESVRKAAQAVVAIKTGVIINNGSGVRIDEKFVLTAGHVFLNEGGEKKISGKCESLMATANDGSGDRTEGPHERVAGEFTTARDIGGFTLSAIANDLPPSAPIMLSPTPPKPGEIVYFANFQPAPDGPRIPGEPNGYNEPAIYAGVVLPAVYNQRQGQITALTGLKSYGAVKDVNSRKGGSGGALFQVINNKAHLSGVLVSGQKDLLTPQGVKGVTGITPTGLPEGSQDNLGISNVQLTPPEVVAALRSEVNAASACTWPQS